ncbi:MAG TPA: lipopolysaccharide transport periplasmic protein LptA [Halioglobus sp.]
MFNCGPDQYVRLLKTSARILLLALVLPSISTQALPDDRDQPIHITADKALRDEKKKVTVYSGNVLLIQGSMELEADTVTIYHTSEEADEIVAEGNPAKMRQKPEPDEGIVHAHAKIIKYFKAADRVLLLKDARIEQDGAVVAGDSIEYLIAKQMITAESDQTKAGKKVSVVIPPNVQQKESNSGATKSE